MDCKNILQEGDEGKYNITIKRQGFLMSRDNFQVKLSWGMLDQSMTIHKNKMLTNEAGDWFFVFDTTGMVGRVVAECSFDIPDEDYPDGFRTEVNRQFLCTVVSYPYPKRICVPAGGGCAAKVVQYERTEASDVEELYSYLVDRKGRQFITSDNETILVIKEF